MRCGGPAGGGGCLLRKKAVVNNCHKNSPAEKPRRSRRSEEVVEVMQDRLSKKIKAEKGWQRLLTPRGGTGGGSFSRHPRGRGLPHPHSPTRGTPLDPQRSGRPKCFPKTYVTNTHIPALDLEPLPPLRGGVQPQTQPLLLTTER